MLPLATHHAICLRAPLHPRQASAILRHAKPPWLSDGHRIALAWAPKLPAGAC